MSVKVGIFGRKTWTSRAIQDAVRELGFASEHISPDKVSIPMGSEETVASDTDIIINWMQMSGTRQEMLQYGLLKSIQQSVPIINDPESVFSTHHKPLSYSILDEKDVPVPDSYASASYDKLSKTALSWGYGVQKPIFGGGGREIEKFDVIHNDVDLELGLLSGPEPGLIQETIETDEKGHSDIRAYVVGNKVVAAMKRKSQNGNWKTNISAGGVGKQYQLPSEARSIVHDAVEAIGVDVAGIDIIKDTQGNWYVLELNTPAGSKGLYRATGVNVGAHIAKYAIEEIGEEIRKDEFNLIANPKQISREREPGNCEAATLSDKIKVAGTDSTQVIDVKINEGINKTLLDLEVANQIGIDKMTGTVDGVRNGPVNQKHPTAAVKASLNGSGYWIEVALVDLSNQKHDMISRSSYIIDDELRDKKE
jgi:RimK family alpha-L-glutamate ligase